VINAVARYVCYQNFAVIIIVMAIPAIAEEIINLQSRFATLNKAVNTNDMIIKMTTIIICPNSKPKLKANN
jgi:hypothetical protein